MAANPLWIPQSSNVTNVQSDGVTTLYVEREYSAARSADERHRFDDEMKQDLLVEVAKRLRFDVDAVLELERKEIPSVWNESVTVRISCDLRAVSPRSTMGQPRYNPFELIIKLIEEDVLALKAEIRRNETHKHALARRKDSYQRRHFDECVDRLEKLLRLAKEGMSLREVEAAAVAALEDNSSIGDIT